MIGTLINLMVLLGAILMVYNIYGFIRFARYIRSMKTWDSGLNILYVPIFLLVFFLIGYVLIGLFGRPNLIMAGVLFGGSVFVQIMYRLLFRIVRKVIESEQQKSELLAAEESSRAKASFLASISHEMRTPMNVIMGMDELALRNPELSSETRDQLEKIGYSARHLSGLIDNLLDIQQADSSSAETPGKQISLSDALDQINAIYSASCAEKGLEYRFLAAENAVREYAGDAFALERALMNILDNAVKFTDAPGTVRFCVDADLPAEGDGVVNFVVSDTGVGIDEAFLPKIFDAFAQEDASSTSRFGGSGVGLAAAYRLIDSMGGKIGAESKKGAGSTFTVTIPMITAGKEAHAEESSGDGENVSPEEFLAGRHILIVDDIPDNAEIVADLLEIVGVESDWAQNGKVAVDMVADSGEYEYDAILMDLRMPEMDGLEATRRIRALDRADTKMIPIIALSANSYESDVTNSIQAGMNAHLAKPADSDQLYTTLTEWIRKRTEQEAMGQT